MYYDPHTNQYLKSSDQVEAFDTIEHLQAPSNPSASARAKEISDESVFSELITSNLNPADPPDIGYATTYALDDTRPSTVQVYPSKENLKWPGGGGYKNTNKSGISGKDCLWSWDASCLPKSSNYIADTSSNDTYGTQLNDPVLNDGADNLIPVSDGLPDGARAAAPCMFKNNGNAYVYENPGYIRTVDPNDASKSWTNIKLSDGTKVNESSLDFSGYMANNPPKIPGTNAHGMFDMAGEIHAHQMVKNLKSLSSQAKYWADMGRKNAMLYNAKTAVAASKYGEIEKTNSLLRKQAGNSTGNDSKVERINSSISSQQRQVQIANDATRRRNENIFLLKLLLVYFLVIAIPLIGKRMFSNNFKTGHAILIIVFISCPFLYILLWNLWSIRNRSPIRWPLRNWPAGHLPPDNDKYQEEAAVCHPPPPCATCEEEAEEIEAEIAADEREIARCKATIKTAKADESKLRRELCKVEKKSGKPAHCLEGSITF